MKHQTWLNGLDRLLTKQRFTGGDVRAFILSKSISSLIQWFDLQDCAIDDSATSIDALKKLQKTDRRFVLLLGRNLAVSGFLTRSPLVAAVVSNSSPKNLKEFVTPRNRIVTIDADATVKTAMQAFSKHAYNQLLVFDKDNKRVGALSRSAVLRWVTEQLLDE